jgi:uncharacterized protein
VIDARLLIQDVLSVYALPRAGIHGVAHWARVLENGRRLGPATGARMEVVESFAILHDACRLNDRGDPDHGPRAVALAATLRGPSLLLSDEAFTLLSEAIAHHTCGQTLGDVTVQTCWDADRLDLYRVGTLPRPQYLCTAAAKVQATIDWAVQRSLRSGPPPLVWEEWGLCL